MPISGGVRNDSPLSLEHIADLMDRDGVELRYGDLVALVQFGTVSDARRYVAQIRAGHLADVRRSVERDLRHETHRNQILKGRSPRRVAQFCWNLALWAALSETRMMALGPAI